MAEPRRDQILQANRELHADEAGVYDQLHTEIFNPVEQARLKRTLSLALAHCTSGGRRALDVGAGTGNLTQRLLEAGFSVLAVDLSPEMLAALVRKHPSEVAEGRLATAVAQAESLPGDADAYDVVGAYSVMHHLPDYLAAIEEMVRLLKPGGVLYLDHEHRALAPVESKLWRLYARLRTVSVGGALRAALRLLPGRRPGPAGPSVSKYWWADYWVTQEQGLDWAKVAALCARLGVREVPTRPFLNHRGTRRDRFLHPLFSPFVADTRVFVGVKEPEPRGGSA